MATSLLLAFAAAGAAVGALAVRWALLPRTQRAEAELRRERLELERARQRIAELERACDHLLDEATRRIEGAVREAHQVMRARGEARTGMSTALGELERSLGSSSPLAPDFPGDGGATQAVGERASLLAEEQAERVRSILDEAEALGATAGLATQTAESIGTFVDGLARLVESLSGAAVDAARASSTMDDAFRRVQANAGETAQISARVSAEAERGYRAVHRTLDEIERIRDLTETARKRIDALGVRVVGIGDIVRVIQEIAEKTNLLALNASIIAAQAGQHGRGFAVVAQEIKALAQKTAASTKQIAEQIRGVQEESERAMEAMANGVAAVTEGFAVALGAGDALGEIRQSARLAQKKVQGISRAMEDQASSSRRVAETAGELADRTAALATSVKDQGARGDRLREAAGALGSAALRITRLAREAHEQGRDLGDLVARLRDESVALARGQRELLRHLGRLHSGAAQLDGLEADVADRLAAIHETTAQLREEIGRLKN